MSIAGINNIAPGIQATVGAIEHPSASGAGHVTIRGLKGPVNVKSMSWMGKAGHAFTTIATFIENAVKQGEINHDITNGSGHFFKTRDSPLGPDGPVAILHFQPGKGNGVSGGHDLNAVHFNEFHLGGQPVFRSALQSPQIMSQAPFEQRRVASTHQPAGLAARLNDQAPPSQLRPRQPPPPGASFSYIRSGVIPSTQPPLVPRKPELPPEVPRKPKELRDELRKELGRLAESTSIRGESPSPQMESEVLSARPELPKPPPEFRGAISDGAGVSLIRQSRTARRNNTEEAPRRVAPAPPDRRTTLSTLPSAILAAQTPRAISPAAKARNEAGAFLTKLMAFVPSSNESVVNDDEMDQAIRDIYKKPGNSLLHESSQMVTTSSNNSDFKFLLGEQNKWLVPNSGNTTTQKNNCFIISAMQLAGNKYGKVDTDGGVQSAMIEQFRDILGGLEGNDRLELNEKMSADSEAAKVLVNLINEEANPQIGVNVYSNINGVPYMHRLGPEKGEGVREVFMHDQGGHFEAIAEGSARV